MVKANVDSTKMNPSLTAWTQLLTPVPDIPDDVICAWVSRCRISSSHQKKGYGNFAEGYVHISISLLSMYCMHPSVVNTNVNIIITRSDI